MGFIHMPVSWERLTAVGFWLYLSARWFLPHPSQCLSGIGIKYPVLSISVPLQALPSSPREGDVKLWSGESQRRSVTGHHSRVHGFSHLSAQTARKGVFTCRDADGGGASLDFQQHSAFPTCLFLPEPGAISGWAALRDSMSTSPTACVSGWEVLALPAFSLPLPTGICLLESKIPPAIFKVLSEPTQLLLPVTDPAVRIFSCFLLPLLQARWQQPGFPPHSHPEPEPGQGPGFSSGGSRGIWCPSCPWHLPG